VLFLETFQIPAGILIVILVIFISFSAFFSASETALTGCNKLRLKNLAKMGDKRAYAVLYLLSRFDKTLTTILIGNNIVNIATASLAAAVCTAYMGASGLALATVITTIIILIFGEILPKDVAKDQPEKYAMSCSHLLSLLVVILTPLTIMFQLIKKMTGRFGTKKPPRSATEEELMLMVDEVENGGDIKKEDGQRIKSAIEFSDIRVREIMTPRVDIRAIDISEGNKAALAIFSTQGFSRLPVFKNDYSEIIGVLHARDFYAAYLKDPNFDLHTILKKVVFVHTSTKIGLVMQSLQKAKVEMAIVIDSYGTIDGLVTTEDIVEELVGEIWDEHDLMVSSFRKIAHNPYLVNCDSNGQNANLFDLFKYLDLDNSTYGLENNSISGWVIDSLGCIPEKGATFDCKNLHITVTKTDAHRVKEIVVEVRPKSQS
jgi:putative hemolysin